MNSAEKFMAAFQGFGAAHGQTQISNERRAGKQKAISKIVRKPLTLELIQSHLDGRQGVGSIPINENNLCKFGALDVDEYPLDLAGLDRRLRELKVPCVVCRSKSGGAHIFFFFKDYIGAGEFRDKASEIAAFIGHGGCEIFPKQEKILAERGDVGNFINLPYFDAEQTLRHAIKEDGEPASLEEFLELVDGRASTSDDFVGLSFGVIEDEFKEWPPCLNCMFGQGVPEGTRNTVMFATAVACKKEKPDDWKRRLEEINNRISSPPLPASEIVTIQDQHEKKEYFYQCNEGPLAQHCNKSLCRTRKYGIGNHAGSVEITGLTVVLSEPRIWFVDVGGSRLELTTEQLQMPMQFQRACMEQLNFMPPKMKEDVWQAIVNIALNEVVEIEVPVELTNKGQFMELLEQQILSLLM